MNSKRNFKEWLLTFLKDFFTIGARELVYALKAMGSVLPFHQSDDNEGTSMNNEYVESLDQLLADNTEFCVAVLSTALHGKIAMMLPIETDIGRLDMMLSDAAEGDWDRYFNSDWFPLAAGSNLSEALTNLRSTAKFVKVDQIKQYLELVTAGYQYLEDNFSWAVPTTLEDGINELEREAQAFKMLNRKPADQARAIKRHLIAHGTLPGSN